MAFIIRSPAHIIPVSLSTSNITTLPRTEITAHVPTLPAQHDLLVVWVCDTCERRLLWLRGQTLEAPACLPAEPAWHVYIVHYAVPNMSATALHRTGAPPVHGTMVLSGGCPVVPQHHGVRVRACIPTTTTTVATGMHICPWVPCVLHHPAHAAPL